MIKKYFIILSAVLLVLSPLFVYAQKDDKGNVRLKTLAEARGRYIGTAVNSDALAKDKEYAQVLAEEFDVVTPENAFKFNTTEPQRGVFDFRNGDAIVDFALAHHMKVRGHTLAWFGGLPHWVKRNKYTKNEVEEILHNHIRTVVGHYKGKVCCWDVVNEAFNDDGSLRNNVWYKAMGPAYIEKAFRWTHEADPDALLFYNDYSIQIKNAKSDALYRLIKELKNKNVPIDGVGFQGHLKIDSYHIKWTDSNMRRFAGLGLQTNFTELDVSIIDGERIDREKQFAKQAHVYKTIFKVCLNNPSCKMVVMWGFTDAHSSPREINKDDAPTIFDEQYKPKPAYDAIIKVLRARSST